jgi:hypothetical protein
MNYKSTLLTIICLLTVACSSQAEENFNQIVARVDKYFSEKPILVTSNKIIKDGQTVFSYYAIKVIEYNLSFDVQKTFSSTLQYNAFIIIKCVVLDNAKNGDLVFDSFVLNVKDRIVSYEASGYSTTNMAIANKGFSSNSKSLTLIIRYSYQDDKWICIDIAGGGISGSLFRDLETFPQNKEFREAVGMTS